MEISIWTNGKIHIIDIQGDMDFADSSRLKKLVMKMIELKAERFIINAGKLRSIDSSGIGALINISSTLKKLGLSLALVNIGGTVELALNKTKIAGFFPIFKDLDVAILALSH